MNNDTKELAVLDNIVANFNEKISSLVINNENDCIEASAFIKSIKFNIETIESKRKELVQPLNEHVKKINLMFKDRVVRLERIAESVRSDVLAYMYKSEQEKLRVEKEQRRLEVEKKRQEAGQLVEFAEIIDDQEEKNATLTNAKIINIEAGQLERKELVVKADTIKSEHVTTSVRKIWTYEVEDLTQVPARFMMLDEKKVNLYIKKGVHEIPGLKIYQKSSLLIK